jgi:NAD-dependent DNA ligase
MTTTDDAARVRELADAITAHRAAYYDGAPTLADYDYDQLEDELRALLAEHPELTPDPNPLEQVGAPSVLHAPVRHERPMLSLEKATSAEQVEAFMARFPGQRVVVMPKLDGLSLAVIYEGGRRSRPSTRRTPTGRSSTRAAARRGRCARRTRPRPPTGACSSSPSTCSRPATATSRPRCATSGSIRPR